MKAQHHPLLMQVFGDHVEQCDDPGHRSDHLSRCAELLSSLAHLRHEDERSSGFTVEAAVSGTRDKVPENGRSTTSLLSAAREALSSPPWRQPLKRSTVIDDAIGLLAGRGIPTEELVRDGLGETIRRRMLLRLSATWWQARYGGGEIDEIPLSARPWAEVFDESAERLGHSPALHDVVLDALGGQVGRRARRSIENSPLAHVIVWCSDEPLVSSAPRDEADAIRWFVDCFTHTSPTMWRTSSLQWELAMSEDPGQTAMAADISEAGLHERPVCSDGALDELSRRVRAPRTAGEPLSAGLTVHDIVGDLVEAITGGHHAQAVALSGSAQESRPDEGALLQISAFCRIPTEPDEARQVLCDTARGSVQDHPTVLANLVCCHLARAEPAEAAHVLEDLARHDLQHHGWWWDP